MRQAIQATINPRAIYRYYLKYHDTFRTAAYFNIRQHWIEYIITAPRDRKRFEAVMVLVQKEWKIMELADGRSSRAIARELHMSTSSVERVIQQFEVYKAYRRSEPTTVSPRDLCISTYMFDNHTLAEAAKQFHQPLHVIVTIMESVLHKRRIGIDRYMLSVAVKAKLDGITLNKRGRSAPVHGKIIIRAERGLPITLRAYGDICQWLNVPFERYLVPLDIQTETSLKPEDIIAWPADEP